MKIKLYYYLMRVHIAGEQKEEKEEEKKEKKDKRERKSGCSVFVNKR